jgi:flotillin
VIRAKGEAEADAMRTKAAAYHEYNQAAVLDKIITNLPEMVRALAEPLSKVDKISIVSTGGANGGNLGASRVTGDLVNIMAQAPALIQALTGISIQDLMARVPAMGTVDAASAPAAEANANGNVNGATNASANDAAAPTAPQAAPEPVAASDNGAEPVAVASNGTEPPSANDVSPNGKSSGPRRQRMR